jgi:hypothetical protein
MAGCGCVISDIVKRRIAPRVDRDGNVATDAHLRASNVIALRAMKIARRGIAPMPYVGCLTARRRNDPKQAGLSKSMPGRAAVRGNASSLGRSSETCCRAGGH